ncbi:uncharacterized protein LOC128851620 [Cuculus canorus]|uniref:uncharacterized protein LOC128851620 n=1 Tax=Cuculus canorus TaxID=55661 RepID=UPI0023AA33BA|nr:uncharacterized protein LOC128851620 [Cuculus canorus]
MCCHAQSLPEESELHQPVKSAEVFRHLGTNEAVEFREENTPNESLMDVEYLQKDNSSSKPKHMQNKSEINGRKLDVGIYDIIKTDRRLKRFLNFGVQESSISGNRENKLLTEQENAMGFGNQTGEEENGRKDCFVPAKTCVSAEMINGQMVNGERLKTQGASKKLLEVEVIYKTTGKNCSRKTGRGAPVKEEHEMEPEINFEQTMKKDEVTQKTGNHAVVVSPYKQQHFSRTHFERQCKERCFTESNSCDILNSEDKEFQVCGGDSDSLPGIRDAILLEKAASSFRELAAHDGSEKTKLNLQSVSNRVVSGRIESDTNKLHGVSLDKSCSIAEKKILEKTNSNPIPKKAKSTVQNILAVSSGNLSKKQCTAKVSEPYPTDFEGSPVQSDPSLGTEWLGSSGDLNANTSPSEIISGRGDNLPLSENGLSKKLLSHGEKVSEKKIPQSKMCGLDSINISRKKQSGEYKFEQGQKCKDLLLVAEMDGRDKSHSIKAPGKNTELQKMFCETEEKASLAKKEKQKKGDNDIEKKRSTTIVKVPECLCNANETVNLRMILNRPKSTFESQNMSRSSDLKLIQHNLNNEYSNDVNYFPV